MSNKTHFQAAITTDFDTQIKALKGTLGMQTNTELLIFLANYYQNPFKSGLSTKQKIERFIQGELVQPTQKINTHTVKEHFLAVEGMQPNINTTKEVLELYSSEIDTHNAKF